MCFCMYAEMVNIPIKAKLTLNTLFLISTVREETTLFPGLDGDSPFPHLSQPSSWLKEVHG